MKKTKANAPVGMDNPDNWKNDTRGLKFTDVLKKLGKTPKKSFGTTHYKVK